MQLLPEHRIHGASLEDDRARRGADVVILEEEGNYIFGDGRGIMKRCVISFPGGGRLTRAGFAAVEESPPRMTEEGEDTLHSCPCPAALLPRYQFNNSRSER